jgi:hypothetical protein
MNEYVTLDNLRSYLSLASADTSDDTELKKFIRDASRAIDRHTRRRFYPVRTASPLRYNIPSDLELVVKEDLLEVKGLSDLNGSSAISSNVFWLQSGDDWNQTPYDRIVIDDSSGSAFNYSGTPQRGVHIDAIVGYHEDYANAWVNTGASLTGTLGATVTLASVSGSAGDDVFGAPSRIQAMNIIKVDEEYMYVSQGTNTSIVQVIRGINGTSAVAHAASATIYRWNTEQDLQTACLELSSYYYAQSKSPYTQRIGNINTGLINLPPLDMLPSTERRLMRYVKHRVYSI